MSDPIATFFDAWELDVVDVRFEKSPAQSLQTSNMMTLAHQTRSTALTH